MDGGAGAMATGAAAAAHCATSPWQPWWRTLSGLSCSLSQTSATGGGPTTTQRGMRSPEGAPEELGDHAVHRRSASPPCRRSSAPGARAVGTASPPPHRGTGTWGRYPCSSFQVGEEEVLGERRGRQAWVHGPRLCLGCSWGAGLGKLGTGPSWCPWASHSGPGLSD